MQYKKAHNRYSTKIKNHRRIVTQSPNEANFYGTSFSHSSVS